MPQSNENARPTPERPFLIGLLIDVSASMASSIENHRGKTTTRLESFRDALEDLVGKTKELSREGSHEKVAPLVKLFAYGFGFGGFLSSFFRGSSPSVRDLLALPGNQTTTVPMDYLANHWSKYKAHVESLLTDMLGNTPMGAGLRVVRDRLTRELATGNYTGQPVLFILSDGEPTDSSPEDVVGIAREIQNLGVLIIACYVTSDDIAEPAHLYAKPPNDWPPGAKLMLECASLLPKGSSFDEYLAEYKWTVEEGGRMFSQINQSEDLSKFMDLVVSPLRKEAALAPTRLAQVRVFVSYSHEDAAYVKKGSLLGYLSGLENEGFEFWHDQRLTAGDLWDDVIKQQIENADIALVLVSQAFLNSKYIRDTEVEAFLKARAKSGMVIFPIILRPCSWDSHQWLSTTQFEPRNGRTIDPDYKRKGSREQLYFSILRQLREVGTRVRRQKGRSAVR